MLIARRFRLSRQGMLTFLGELAATEGSALSFYLPPSTPLPGIEGSLQDLLGPDDNPPGMHEAIGGSETGAVLFWGAATRCLVLPPFPIPERLVSEGYDIGPLLSLLSHDFLVALVLVRLGAYSIGICKGAELMDSKTGTGLVHARHKKGGSSQARFARHREKQVEYFLDRVCTHAREHIEPHVGSLDYLVYGGARGTILSLRKQCPFLRRFEDRTLRMLLDIPQPRRTVLEKSVGSIWSSIVIEWREAAL